MSQMRNLIDSVNSCLLNGYFANAVTILHDLNKMDLVEEIIQQYRIIFPDRYPHCKTFFNSYIDNKSMRLIQMPYVEGLEDFVRNMNEIAGDDEKTEDFKVYAKISPTNKLIQFEVIPAQYNSLFRKAMHLLRFSNRRNEASTVVIKIGRSKSRKRYFIENERALTDPGSPMFQKQFQDMSAVQ